MSRVVKGFRIRETLARAFETTCKAMGLREYEVIEELIAEWLEKIRGQLKLEDFMNDRKESTINITIKQTQINLIIAKIAELNPKRRLHEIQEIDPENLPEHKKQTILGWLPETIRRAATLLEAAKIYGLQEEAKLLEQLTTQGALKLKQIIER